MIKIKSSVLLERLLALLALVSQPCFYLIFETLALALTIGLTIGRVELISKKITIGFSKHFL